MISFEDFDKVEMRAGTVLDVKEKKSRNPAYVVTTDFGEEIEVKKSSAQLTTVYKVEIPVEVRTAFEQLKTVYGKQIRKADPAFASQ